MDRLKQWKLSMPAAIVLAVGLASIAAILIWAPADARAELLAADGAVFLTAQALLRQMISGGGGPALALAFVMGASSLSITGCGASTNELAATSAEAMHVVQVETGPRIRALRRDAMVRAGTRVHDAGGSEADAHAAVDAEARRWTCAVEGHRLYSLGVGSFIDALFLATVQERNFEVRDLLPYLSRAVTTYRSLSSCLRALDVDLLPETPRFLTLLPSPWIAQLGAPRPGEEGEAP